MLVTDGLCVCSVKIAGKGNAQSPLRIDKVVCLRSSLFVCWFLCHTHTGSLIDCTHSTITRWDVMPQVAGCGECLC